MISRLPEIFVRDGMAETLLTSLGYITMPDRTVLDSLKFDPDSPESGNNWELCRTTEQALGYVASTLTILPAESSQSRPIDWEIDYPELADD